jgi:outer membrane protein TolC
MPFSAIFRYRIEVLFVPGRFAPQALWFCCDLPMHGALIQNPHLIVPASWQSSFTVAFRAFGYLFLAILGAMSFQAAVFCAEEPILRPPIFSGFPSENSSQRDKTPQQLRDIVGEDARSTESPLLRSAIRMQTRAYTLTQAVQEALKNYPSLRAAMARIAQQDANITLQKTAYLPQVNVLAQELRTTTNVIAGSVFPQTLDVIPMQTGQETHSSSFKSVFANNVGSSFSWELYDFGLRHANVLLARCGKSVAGANYKLTELDVANIAAQTYLETVADKETIRAQQATVERMRAWQIVVHTLVDRGLKPGVDSARADADLAQARINLIRVHQSTELAQVDLAETLGTSGYLIEVEDSPWIRKPISYFEAPQFEVENHPLAILRTADVRNAQAQVHVFDKSWYPHIWWHSGMWGRGSGVRNDPRVVADGVLPQTANWVAGFSISFPIFDVYKVKAEKHMAVRNEQAERANYDLAVQILMQKDARARIMLEEARRIADETQFLITSARENELKALERYRVGLSNIVEVAESEEILARAEMEYAVAQVRVWQGILETAYAQGDIKPFMTLASLAEARK